MTPHEDDRRDGEPLHDGGRPRGDGRHGGEDVPVDGERPDDRQEAPREQDAEPRPDASRWPGWNGRLDPQAEAARRRAEIRRFALEHHPDRGGDPEYFAAGLRALRAGRPPPAAGGRDVHVTVYHRPVGLGIVTAWARRRWTRIRRPPRVR